MSRKVFFVIGAFLLTGAAMLPLFPQVNNCGGNSAALAQVQVIALVAQFGTLDAPEQGFRFAAPNEEYREQLAGLARNHWLTKARFLVTTAPIFSQEKEPRRIIAVCDTPYRNVPERWIGSAPPTHAVAFSDGHEGLIFPAEFAALDRSTFVPLDELYPPPLP